MIDQETREALPVRKLDALQRIEESKNPKFDCEKCDWPVPLLSNFQNRRGNKACCLNCQTWQINPFYDGRGLNARMPVSSQKMKEAYVFEGCHLFTASCPSCKVRIQAVITPEYDRTFVYRCGCGLAHSAEGLFSRPDKREETDQRVLWGMFEKFAKKIEVWA